MMNRIKMIAGVAPNVRLGINFFGSIIFKVSFLVSLAWI